LYGEFFNSGLGWEIKIDLTFIKSANKLGLQIYKFILFIA